MNYFQRKINKHAKKNMEQMVKRLDKKYKRLDAIARLVSRDHGFLACASLFNQMEEIRTEIRYFQELICDIENRNINTCVKIKKSRSSFIPHVYFVFNNAE